MNEVLGRNAYGVAVRQPNGQVLFLPPSAAVPPQPPIDPQPEDLLPPTAEQVAAASAPPGAPDLGPPLAPPPGMPAEAAPPLAASSSAPSAPLPPLAAAPPPLGSTGPEALGAPVPVGAVGAPSPLSAGAAVPAPAPAPAPAAGAPSPSPLAAPPLTTPSPTGGPTGGPPAPPNVTISPEEEEAAKTLTLGVLAQQKAEDEAALIRARNAEVEKLQTNKVEAHAILAKRNQELLTGYQEAMRAKADYNAKLAKQDDDDGPSIAQIIILSIGALGAALNRDPRGVQPILDIFARKAEINAKKQVTRLGELDKQVDAQQNLLSASNQQAKALTESLKIEEGALLEKYARDVDEIAKRYQGQEAYVTAQKVAAGIRRTAEEKARSAANDQQKLEIDRKRIEQDDINSRRTTSLGYSRIAEDKAQREMIDKRTRELAEADNKLKERDLLLKEAAHALDVDTKTGERRIFGLPEVNIDGSGAPIIKNGKPVLKRTILTNSDGKEWRPGTKEEAVLARSTIGSAVKSTTLIDKATTLIDRYGWSSDLLRSSEWQAVQSTFTEIQMSRKSEGDLALGVITGPDMELLGKILGGDPTGVRDPVPSLRTARANILIGVNSRLVGLGYDGAAFDSPEISSRGLQEKLRNTPAEELVRKAQARGKDNLSDIARLAGWSQKNAGDLDALTQEDMAALRKSAFDPRSKIERDVRAYPTQGAAAAIVALGRGAADKSNSAEDRAAYLDGLRVMAQDKSPVVRKRAAAAARMWGLDIGTVEGEGGKK